MGAPSVVARPRGVAPESSVGQSGALSSLTVAAWAALIAVALVWGHASIGHRGLAVDAAPLVGAWQWHASWAIVVPAMFGGAVVGYGPTLAARARWGAIPWITGSAASLWTLALAASDGWYRVTAPLTSRFEYEPFAAGIGGVGPFLRTFVEGLPNTPVHVQGHPPGATLVPWALDAIGLGGAGWFAFLVIGAWGVAVGATLVATRSIGGEVAARRAAPALVLLPAAVWAGTSADALFAGVLAVAVALAVTTRRVGAFAGGVVLGAGLLATYGGLALAAMAGVVQVARRRPLALVLTALGGLAVLAAVELLSGFSWLDGLAATRRAYESGVASERPARYFALVGNPAALALLVGPAVAVGLVRSLRRWREPVSLLPLAALMVLIGVNASLLSKGEVERIWLPFAPWLALAAPGDRRGWLSVQMVLALGLQVWLRSKW